MYAGYISHLPAEALPYRVFLQRNGEVIRVQPAGSKAEANRALTDLIQGERAYEKALRWDGPDAFELDA